jgi:hypothetical protein
MSSLIIYIVNKSNLPVPMEVVPIKVIALQMLLMGKYVNQLVSDYPINKLPKQ